MLPRACAKLARKGGATRACVPLVQLGAPNVKARTLVPQLPHVEDVAVGGNPVANSPSTLCRDLVAVHKAAHKRCSLHVTCG